MFFGGELYLHICIFQLFPKNRGARNLLSWKKKKKIVLFHCLPASTPLIIFKSISEFQTNLIRGLESNISVYVFRNQWLTTISKSRRESLAVFGHGQLISWGKSNLTAQVLGEGNGSVQRTCLHYTLVTHLWWS